MDNLLKKLRKILLKEVGMPCKDFEFHCYVCQAWMAYEILIDLELDKKDRN